MVTMTEFAAAFGLDEKHDGTWTILGKVTTVTASKLFVKIGNSSTAVAVERYCDAAVGDIVYIVIENGTARAIACRGGQSTATAGCYFGTLINSGGAAYQLQLVGDYPAQFHDGTLVTARCYFDQMENKAIRIGIVNGSGGLVYVHDAPTSSSNPLTWVANDMLLLCYFKYNSESRFYLVSHYS